MKAYIQIIDCINGITINASYDFIRHLHEVLKYHGIKESEFIFKVTTIESFNTPIRVYSGIVENTYKVVNITMIKNGI